MNHPWLGAVLVLALSGTLEDAAAGPFVNGGFASGYAGWQGVLLDFSGGSPVRVPVDPETTPAFFATPSGGLAGLTLDSSRTDIGLTELSQTFDIEDPADTLSIRLDWDWNPSDATADTFAMALTDGTTLVSFVDLLFPNPPDPPDFAAAAAAGLRQDSFVIPAGSFAGTRLTLLFSIFDADFDLSDRLRVGTIEVTKTAIPAPPTLALLGLGFYAAAVGARRHGRP